MHIRNPRPPAAGPTRPGFTPLLKFNLEVADGLLLYDLQISRAADGRHFLYAPIAHGAPTSSMSPAMRSRVIALAQDALEGCQNDRCAA